MMSLMRDIFWPFVLVVIVICAFSIMAILSPVVTSRILGGVFSDKPGGRHGWTRPAVVSRSRALKMRIRTVGAMVFLMTMMMLYNTFWCK